MIKSRTIAVAALGMMATISTVARAPRVITRRFPTNRRVRPSPTTQPISAAVNQCSAVARGLTTFLDRRLDGLDGNGRSCADCHMPSDHFQLSPADVEYRYRVLKLLRLFDRNADDPLFRPIDADDFRINGNQAQRLQ